MGKGMRAMGTTRVEVGVGTLGSVEEGPPMSRVRNGRAGLNEAALRLMVNTTRTVAENVEVAACFTTAMPTELLMTVIETTMRRMMEGDGGGLDAGEARGAAILLEEPVLLTRRALARTTQDAELRRTGGPRTSRFKETSLEAPGGEIAMVRVASLPTLMRTGGVGTIWSKRSTQVVETLAMTPLLVGATVEGAAETVVTDEPTQVATTARGVVVRLM